MYSPDTHFTLSFFLFLFVDLVFKNIGNNKRPEKIASLIHACVSAPIALYVCCTWKYEAYNVYDPLAAHLIQFTRGYFFWDVLYCIWYKRPVWFVHAAVCFWGYTIASSNFMMFEAVVFLTYEFSTIFLQLFYLTKYKNECVMMFVPTYFFIRIVFGSYFSYYTIIKVWTLPTHRVVMMVVSTLVSVSYGLNIMWARDIYNKFRGK